MECPIIIPVEKIDDYQDHRGKKYYRIIDVAKCTVAEGLLEPIADYIITAINSHEKLVKRISDLERLGRGYIEISEEVLKDQMVNVELGYKFRGKKEIFEQALKEAE